MSVDNFYPSKLLLFGEHSVLIGSEALAVPLPRYYMKWVRHSSDHPTWLNEYSEYLKEKCSDFIDLEALGNWMKKYTIEANIPIGYGLGSSGALTAAIYDVAGRRNDMKNESDLQERFGVMESFFHGKSSGFDPVISFYKRPIVRSNSGIQIMNDNITISCYVYILNSGHPRQGKNMIERFLLNKEDLSQEYAQLIQLNNLAIHQTLTNSPEIFDTVGKISQFQMKHMKYMIINDLIPLWEHGLHTDEYYIKVCGAGGGGYYLVFANQELNELEGFSIEKIEF